MFNLEDCMAFAVNQSAKIFSKALEGVLAPYNITKSQWIALYYLYTYEEMNQKELADKMQLRGPTVVNMLQKLEGYGYLYRDCSHKDKREKCIKLSEEGIGKVEELLPVVEKYKNNIISGISQDELCIFQKCIDKMLENSDKYYPQ